MANEKLISGEKLVDITPEIIAELFCDLDSEQQARFFNHVASVASTWSSHLCFQMQYITDEDGLTLAGRRVMQMIGEYSHWGINCQLENIADDYLTKLHAND